MGMTEKPMVIAPYKATDLIATDGVALGEPISFADELVLDDVYQLTPHSQPLQLELHPQGDSTVFARPDRPGNTVHMDCCLTLMTPTGATIEALILVDVADGMAEGVYLLPLGVLESQMDYRLVGIERQTATRRLALAGCGAFASGTRISLADGRLCPVERLNCGDLVLTRDRGPQPLRWTAKTTLRATGSFAPVVISKGTLHNDADLVVRADHKIFVYQRADHLGTGRAEVLIRARQLIDDVTVYRRTGGFIDYYQLVLDAHDLVYAEGICAETQRIDAISRPGMPEGARLPDHPPNRLTEYEVAANLIAPSHAAALLRKASMR